ncbi:MAG: hypothetical protein HY881_23150 [Deltaproteobacteria bacterium]|nr:hypothetical protein [Deltaproteobacteria bacterium]
MITKHILNITRDWCFLLAAVVVMAMPGNLFAQDMNLNSHFNQPGNILIADQFNNRVIEADMTGNIIWSFGLGPNDFSAKSIIGVNDAQRVGPFTLMAGTGTPAGVIPEAINGAPDNRVILVNPNGLIVWQYGQFGQNGSGPNLLSTPVQCTFLPDFHFLITDQGNNRIIEVDQMKEIVWQYPGSNTNPPDQLNSPNSAELLENGNILIADENNNRAIEVTREDQIVNTITAGGTLGAVAFASRLKNGNTLLTDAGNIGNNVGYDLHTTQKGLYAPYDAKVVGDYTGLTPPFDFDNDSDNQ